MEEALRRLELQLPLGQLNAEIERTAPETFAGMYLQHTPEFKLIVRFTDKAEETLKPYIQNHPLADLIEARTAPYSLTKLQSERQSALDAVASVGIEATASVKVMESEIELYVIEWEKLDEVLQNGIIQLPDIVRVVPVEQFTYREVNVYGGLAIRQGSHNAYASTGFSVRSNSSGETGITTAGHADNHGLTLTDGGHVLGYELGVDAGAYDVQWHTTPTLDDVNWVRDISNDSTPNYHVITAIKTRDEQMFNEFVCKYGAATQYTCGFITDKMFTDSGSSTYIRVEYLNSNLSEGGDSGASWFGVNTAYGIHTGAPGSDANDAYYMAIDYTSVLNVTVLTGDDVFLPDVRLNDGGFTSTIFVRNNGSVVRDAHIIYFNESGTAVGTDACIGLQPQATCLHTPQGQGLSRGSAIVTASTDISVVVYTDGAARGSLDNGFAPQLGGVGDATFEQAGTVLYAPAFYKNYFSINSSVSIVNVGTEPTTVNVEFIGRTGYTNTVHTTPNIPAGGRVTVNGSPVPQTPWVGSLRLTSTGVGASPAQPIVAMVNDDTTANPVYSRSYNATKFGSPLVYVPAAYRTLWGFNTGLVVQNLGTSTTNVTLTFCPRLVGDPTQCPTTTINNLEPLKAQGVLLSNLPVSLFQGQTGWTGSVKLQTDNGVPIAVAVTNSNGVGGYNYSATGRGGRTVFLPYAAKNANGISTGYTVRNVSSGEVTVQAIYYNQNGTRLTDADETFTLLPAQVRGNAQILNGGLPNPPQSWQGSIVLQATGNIVAMMRADDVTPSAPTTALSGRKSG